MVVVVVVVVVDVVVVVVDVVVAAVVVYATAHSLVVVSSYCFQSLHAPQQLQRLQQVRAILQLRRTPFAVLQPSQEASRHLTCAAAGARTRLQTHPLHLGKTAISRLREDGPSRIFF